MGRTKGVPRAVKTINLDLKIIAQAAIEQKSVRDFIEQSIANLQVEVKRREFDEKHPDLYSMDELVMQEKHYADRLELCRSELARRANPPL